MKQEFFKVFAAVISPFLFFMTCAFIADYGNRKRLKIKRRKGIMNEKQNKDVREFLMFFYAMLFVWAVMIFFSL